MSAGREADTHTAFDWNDLLLTIELAPHLPLAFQEVPDLLDGVVSNGD
jgi:hypothetical protein